jgi:predicted nucleic acid-binding protein
MIFADTSYFLALLNPDDQWHHADRQAASDLSEPLLSTEWVLVELANAMARPLYRLRCAAFIHNLRAAGLEYVPAGSDWLERGLALYESRRDKEWSLTDCISFVVMQTRGLSDALTAEHHFEQAGFRALLRV